MNAGSAISIVSYTGMFCFTRKDPDWPFSQMSAFVVIIFLFFVIKFFIGRYYIDIDAMTSDLIKRQKFILNSFTQKNISSGATTKIQDAVPFLKIYGTFLEDKQAVLKKNN